MPGWELFVGLGFIAWLIGVLVFVFWLWMLIDCLTNASLQPIEKLVWVLVLIFLNFIGAIIYFFVAKSPGGRPSV